MIDADPYERIARQLAAWAKGMPHDSFEQERVLMEANRLCDEAGVQRFRWIEFDDEEPELHGPHIRPTGRIVRLWLCDPADKRARMAP